MDVLIAIDGSKDAAVAMESALRLLRLDEGRVDTICVVPDPPSPMTGWRSDHRLVDRYRRKTTGEAKRIATLERDSLLNRGNGGQAIVECGSPAAVIIRRSADYDVVVAGAKGKGERSEAGLGSVVSRLAEHAFGCTFIGRPMRSETGVRILVPLDGSEAANDALDKMIEMVGLDGVEVRLIHVVESPWLHFGLDQEWLSESDHLHERIDPSAYIDREMLKEAEQILESARVRFPKGQTAVSTMIQQGLPANEILTEAERGEYDLVVLGVTRGTDLKHWLLGSVSSKTAWNAPCSVLLVKPD